MTAHAVCHDVLDLRVQLFMIESLLLRTTDDGIRHGVRIVLLETGCHAKHLVGILVPEGDDIDETRYRVGQGAGLIKDDGVRLRHGFHELAALDGDTVIPRFLDRRQHRKRYRELQGAGVVHHQEGQRLRKVPGQEIGRREAGEAVRHERICEPVGLRFRVGLQLLGLLNHMHDLVVLALARLLLHLDEALAFLDHGAGINIAALGLRNRSRLTGHRRLVDRHLTGDDHTLERDDIRTSKHDHIAGMDLSERHFDFLLALPHPRTIDVQRHSACQIADRLLPCPVLEGLADVEEEHDGGGCRVVRT